MFAPAEQEEHWNYCSEFVAPIVVRMCNVLTLINLFHGRHLDMCQAV